MNKIAIILVFLCSLLLPTNADAQVQVNAPQQVVMGERFQIRYVLENKELDNIQLGDVSGFDILAGPYTSTQSSFQMINGRTSQSSSVTITYVLMPTCEGRHTIGPATLISGSSQIKSKSVTIEVLPSDKTPSQAQQSVGSNQEASPNQESARSSDAKDLFITVTASKKRVYEQEAVLLTYKVYTLLNLVQLSGNMPELNGCHQQEIELSQQKSLKMEHYNGRNYRTCVWSQYVVFPQQTGKVTIPPIKFEGIVQQVVRPSDPFEAFFSGNMVRDIRRTIIAPSIELQVDALPTPKPSNFSGAVGQFKLSGTLTPEQLKVNEALTLRLVVSGTGNMKLIKTPKVDFPTDFETYDAKVTDKTKIGVQGASGNKVYDYVAVPRHGGEYTVPAVEFCYFDPQTKSYKTEKTDEFIVKVEKGAGVPSQSYSAVEKEDLQMLAEDIRFIKRGDTHPVLSGTGFFGSLRYIAGYLLSLIIFCVLVLVFRRQIAANADIARRRGKKASKQANKRLKKARRMLKDRNVNDFYDEVLRALWGFVADKLNIDVAELSKDNVKEKLISKGYSDEMVDQFMNVVSECEYARYAPGDTNENMDKTYNNAEEWIKKF